MAKKKNKPAKPAATDFSNSPFKNLKGLSAFEEQNRGSTCNENGQRDSMQIQTEEGALAGWTYFANPAVIVPGLKPPRSYLEHLLAGRPYLSDPYFRMLESWECADDS